jgi:hypothetical protein
MPWAADKHLLAIPWGRGSLSGDPSPGPGDCHPLASPGCPLTKGMSAQGMTAIPSLCPLLQGMGSKAWHSSPESEPLRKLEGMGWGRTQLPGRASRWQHLKAHGRTAQHACAFNFVVRLQSVDAWVCRTATVNVWNIGNSRQTGSYSKQPCALQMKLMGLFARCR